MQDNIDTLAAALHKNQTNPLPPSLEEIGEASQQITKILFPDQPLTQEQVKQQILGARKSLRALIARATQSAKSDQHDLEGVAEMFLQDLPAIREWSRTDIAAALRGDPAAKDEQEVMSYYPGFRATLLYRIAHALYARGVPYIPRGITEYAHRITGIDIHPGAKIGSDFFIDHGTGVVIGETAEIGNRVKLYQGVTLGAKSFRSDENGQVIREEKRHPTIEDDVTIYANATILGGKTVIGRGAVIGASAWLTESVEPGTRVGISPPNLRKTIQA